MSKERLPKVRVSVSVPGSFFPLHADLAAQPAHYRAERIRQLATIGLLACTGNLPAHASVTDTSHGGEPSEQARAESVAAIRGLLDGT